MKTALNYRGEIYGFLTLWVMFFHMQAQIPVIEVGFKPLSNFIRMGDFAVDVFFFISGYCVSLSFQRANDVLAFLRKRIIRVGVPLLIISFPFFIWRDFIAYNSSILRFGYDLCGLSFWIGGDLSIWFGLAILLFYLITPVLFDFASKRWGPILLLATSVVSLYLLYRFDQHLEKTSIAWMRLPVYLTGLICGIKNSFILDLLKNKISKILSFGISFLLFFGLFFFLSYRQTVGLQLETPLKYCIYLLMVIPFIFLASSIFSLFPEWINICFRFIGKYSLELYLTHTLLLTVFRHHGWIQVLGLHMIPVLLCLSLVLSFLTSKATEIIQRISLPALNNRESK